MSVQRINKAFTVYIDSVFGDSNTGLVERMDAPFLTLESAIAAIHSDKSGTWTIHISTGTYEEAGIQTKENYNYNIVCAAGVVVNVTTPFTYEYTDADVIRGFRNLYIQGGSWNYNGDNIFFDGLETNQYIISDALIQNNTGGSVFQKSVVSSLKRCTIKAIIGFVFNGEKPYNIVEHCHIESQSNYIFNPSMPAAGYIFINCSLKSLTHGLSNNTSTGSTLYFDNCKIVTYSTAITTRGLVMQMVGFNKVEITNGGSFVKFEGDGSLDMVQLNIDTLIVSHPIGDTSKTIDTSGDNKVNMFVSSMLLSSNTSTEREKAAVGLQITTATIGNNITFNLPAPYDNNIISYELASTVIADELAAIVSLIEAEISNPTSDWYTWADEGDVSSVEVDSDTIIVRGYKELPGGFLITSTTDTVTDDLSEVIEANQGWQGLFNYGNGEIDIITPNSEIYLSSGKRIIDTITKLNTK